MIVSSNKSNTKGVMSEEVLKRNLAEADLVL
jgi:hypothetical protein